MTTTTPALSVADTNDIDPVAALVAAAFGFLEVIRWLVPSPGRRWEVSRGWYRPEVYQGFDRGVHSAAVFRLSGTFERTA
jgi:hypothetical protein